MSCAIPNPSKYVQKLHFSLYLGYVWDEYLVFRLTIVSELVSL